MTSTPFALRWGILATGAISTYFCKDLLTDPETRDVRDIRHEIVAVAASTSQDKAAQFVQQLDAPGSIRAYGSYAELVADPHVDIIYVATPHSHHFQNAMLALQAGKHVLCEKPFTVAAAQTRELVKVAKQKGLFLMEAVWTRFFPICKEIQSLVQSNEIGSVYRVTADLSRNKSLPNGELDYEESHRMVNKDLAGGVLLALGVYPLTWVFQILYHSQPRENRESPSVVAAVNRYRTGIDDSASTICHFPNQNAMGIATSSLRVDPCIDSPAIRIQGSKGEIQVQGPAFRPLRYSVKKYGGDQEQVFDHPIPRDEKRDWGNGTFWEADECARCIRDGKQESEIMPWEESIEIMDTVDLVLKQGGVTYPELITSAAYDQQSPLNLGRAS